MSKIIKCMFFVLISRSSSTVGSRTAGDLTFAGRNGAQSVPGVGGQRKCILSI